MRPLSGSKPLWRWRDFFGGDETAVEAHMPFVFGYKEDREVISLSMDGGKARGVSGVQLRPRMCM